VLSLPVRRVPLPPKPPGSLFDHHRVNPPLLEPLAYAVDEAESGRHRVSGTYVLSPGDVRGTRFVHEWCVIGCWSLHAAAGLSMACDRCGAMVAGRTDDCGVAQETRFDPDAVVVESCEKGSREASEPDPFALAADWDDGPEPAFTRWRPQPTRRRTELLATRWRAGRLKADLYRDDPPA
jgi:hypothetical protein